MNGPYVVVITRERDTWEVRAPVGIPHAGLMFGLRRLPTGLRLASAGTEEEPESEHPEPTVLIRFDRNAGTSGEDGEKRP